MPKDAISYIKPNPSKAEPEQISVLSYIEDMLGDLARLAGSQGLPVLAAAISYAAIVAAHQNPSQD